MKKITLLLLIIFSAPYISTASNFPIVDSPTYKALFIGIDNYKVSSLGNLLSSSKDSRSLKNVLERKYGFTDSKVLMNESATKQNILSSIRKLASGAAEEDHLLLFFAGHGAELDNEGYWVPADASSLDASELVSNIDVQQIIKATKSKHVLILSNGFFAGKAFKSPSFFINNDGSEGYYKKIQMLISRQAITSGGASPTFDADENKSVFTKYLLKFLEVNETNVLDSGELYELIKYPIFSNSPNMPRFGHLQYTGHEGGQFVFRISEKKEKKLTVNTLKSAISSPDKIKKEPKVEVCNLETSIKQGDKLIVDNLDDVAINVEYNNKAATVQWLFKGKEIGSAKELSINEVGKYEVVVSTTATCKKSATITVAQKEVDLSKVDVFIEEGNSVEYTMKGTLSAKTFTKEAIEYEWRLGGLVVSDEPVLMVFRSGEYEVSLKYNGKEIAKDHSMVIVHPRTYTSVQGDTPKKVAAMFYSDDKLESLIYKANISKIKIGKPIPINTNLVIPAKEEAQQGLSIKSLNIAGVSNFAPFSSIESYKNGIVTDIIKTVFNKMEQTNEFLFVPLTKQGNLILTNKVLAAYPIRKTAENLNKYIFTKELYRVDNVIYSRAAEPFDYSNKKNIKKKKVAFVTGSDIKEIDELLARRYIKVRPCTSLEEAFRLLQREQVDLIICSSLGAYHVFMNNEKIKQEAFYLVNQPIGTTSLHLAVSNRNPFGFDIIASFNAMFEQLTEEGIIIKLIDEHLDEFQKRP